MNLLKNSPSGQLILTILFSFLSVAWVESVACGDLLVAPSPAAAIDNLGASTRVRIEGNRVYALVPSNGGTGPNRWMRMNVRV